MSHAKKINDAYLPKGNNELRKKDSNRNKRSRSERVEEEIGRGKKQGEQPFSLALPTAPPPNKKAVYLCKGINRL